MGPKLKMRIKLYAALLAVVSASAGCSGGGGGGGDDFAGVWNGSVTLVEDSCGFVSPDYYIYFTHLVNQSETQVVLDNGFETFTGAPANEGFLVSNTREIVSPATGGPCSAVISWRYDAIEKDYAGFVVRTTDMTCGSGAAETKCKISFSGSGYRTTSNISNPIPITEDNSNEAGVQF